MKKDEYCKVLCKRKIESNYEEKIYEWMIEREYTSSWFLDSLPAGLNYTYKNGIHSDRVLHDFGIPIGEQFGIDTQAYIYNHLTFEIFVNNDSKSTNPFTIVEFNIIPWRYYLLILVSIMRLKKKPIALGTIKNSKQGEIGNLIIESSRK
jgi:hypothetical protein